MTARIAIVGAGPGGLAAAMLLARAGADVSVHERLDHVGGRSATIAARTPAGTFRFDRGPTFFLYPRVLAEIFATCGRDLHREVELIRLDPLYRLAFEDAGEIDIAGEPERLAAEIARLAPQDALALPRFMAEGRGKLAAFRPALEMPFTGLSDFLRPEIRRALPLLKPFQSVDRALARHFRDPRVRLAFSFQTQYLGMSPFRCPSLFTILAFMEHEYGVWHPRGGCGAVMEAMARVARLLGVRIHLNDPVEQILFDGRRAIGLRTGLGAFAADAIVINADFAQAMTSLVPNALRSRWSDRRIARKKFSCSTFMLYLGLEGSLDDIAHHTVHLARDYRRNLAEIEAGRAPPREPSFYVQNACVTDPELAPSGHSTLYVLVPVSNCSKPGINWQSEAPRYRRLVLDRLARIGIRDLDRRIRFEKMLTPQDWRAQLAIHEGATFNLAHTIGQMLHLRPHNRFEDLDRVYLVGGGTHPGSGLPVIFEGARITSRLLAEDLGLSVTALPAPEPAPLLAAAQ
jgi:phytoene desaturase